MSRVETRASEFDPQSNITENSQIALSKPRIHLDYVDGLRGLAISLVLLFHIWEDSNLPSAYWWNPLSWSYCGVTLFLLLSGFCLYWPMVRSYKPSPEPRLADFAKRRARRIMGPYLIVLTTCSVGAWICYQFGTTWPDAEVSGSKAILTAFLWHLVMLQNLRPSQIFALNGPFWSLALESSLYVAMPLLVFIARKRGIIWSVLFAAVVTLGYRIFCDQIVGGPSGWHQMQPEQNFVLIEFLPGQLFVFALGMWAAKLVATGAVKVASWVLGAVFVACLAIAGILVQILTRYNPYSDSIFALGFFALILNSSMIGSVASNVMRWRPIVWLGEISYSVYLLHYPLMHLGYQVSGMTLHSKDRTLFGVGLLMMPIIIGISFVFHKYCERPFMNSPQTSESQIRFAGTPLAIKSSAAERVTPQSSETGVS